MESDNGGDGLGREHPGVDWGDPSLPGGLTQRKADRIQGFDTTPPKPMTDELRTQQMIERRNRIERNREDSPE